MSRQGKEECTYGLTFTKVKEVCHIKEHIRKRRRKRSRSEEEVSRIERIEAPHREKET